MPPKFRAANLKLDIKESTKLSDKMVTVEFQTAPPNAPSGYYWLGDYRLDLQDFSSFDTHDANLSTTLSDSYVGSTKGSVIVQKQVPWYPFSGYVCRETISPNFPSSSVSGAATMLWQPGNYGNSWEQDGQKFWSRLGILFPNNTDSNYPGNFTPETTDGLQNTWRIFMEWHINDSGLQAHGGGTASSSTVVEIGRSPANTSIPCLLLRPIGGTYGNTKNYYIVETNQTQTKVNTANTGTPLGTVQPLQFNHWYDILVYQELSTSATTGYIEWWVDGNLRFADHLATISGAQDGFVPGLGYQAGLYRGSTVKGSTNEHVYLGPMVTGPTRASVGA